MKKTLCLVVILFSVATIAQQNHEVIILPKKFGFLKEENKFNLNALTKSFFETEGFTVYYAEDTLPKDIANNSCASMFADVIENNNFFTTKLEVVLKDCQNLVLVSSKIGTSKEKDHFKAHNEALRSALISLRGKLNVKKDNTNLVMAQETLVVEKKAEKLIDVTAEKSANPNQLFALPTTTGFKLVDSKPDIIIELKATTSNVVFIANKGDITGVFIEKGNGWYFEYYQNNRLISEKTEVKF